MASENRTRRYLTGLDWVMASLDTEMRRTTGGGNNSQVVLGTRNPLNPEKVMRLFQSFAGRFPHFGMKIARNPWNLAPVWKFPEDARGIGRDGAVLKAGHEEDLHAVLEAHVNHPLPESEAGIRAAVVEHADGTRFALSFDHRVLDALGAERFISDFNETCENEEASPRIEDYLSPNSPGLSRWADKFRGGRFVNRMFLKLSQVPCRRLAVPNAAPPLPFRFQQLQFSTGETEAVLERAWDKAGYLMEMPYFLAAATQALHSVFETENAQGAAYSIPVTTDTRPQSDRRGETFFNYASFLFFQLPLEQVFNRIRLIQAIKRQMYEQVQNRFPAQVADASMLLRIAPLSIVGRIMAATMRRRASFSFSYLGRSGYSHERFCGEEISSLFHMPRVPYPPGAGIFFNISGGRLHVTLSWLSGLTKQAYMVDAMDRLKNTL